MSSNHHTPHNEPENTQPEQGLGQVLRAIGKSIQFTPEEQAIFMNLRDQTPAGTDIFDDH